MPGSEVGTPSDRSVVYIVDDDDGIRDALGSLLRSANYQVVGLKSAKDFIDTWTGSHCGCLVLDVKLPDIMGLDFQQKLLEENISIPIVFVTGNADVPSSVRGMKAGAVDFLQKPVDGSILLEAVAAAMARDRLRREADEAVAGAIARFSTLTVREKEVMMLVTQGLMNKQVAGELNLQEITVKVHRGTMMRKMGVRSFADLVREVEMLKTAGICPSLR